MATETEKNLIRSIVSRYQGASSPTPSQPTADDDDIDYRAMAHAAALEAGLDPDLFDSLVRNESNYNPEARSGVGAIGLTQLMPGTAAELGVDPHDPEDNLRGGATYLRRMIDRYKGNTEKAVAAYNFGPGNVDAGRPWPKETIDYTRRVLGGRGLSKAPPPPTPTPGLPPPQDGVPEWVPTAGRNGQALDPLTRRMLAKLGPPVQATTETPYYLAAPEQPQEAPPAAEAAPAHTIGDRIMSGLYSFGQGLGTLPTGMLDSIAILARESHAMFGNQKELDEYASAYMSKRLQEAADYWFPQDEILKGEFLANMLPNALGQGAGFIAGGLITGGGYAFPAITGAAIGGAQAYQEAQAMGATEDAQLQTFLINAGIGTSEALPIGHLIEGLDKGTGGIFKRALIEAGKQTFEEGIQEALQQTGQNAVAKWLYDNQRGILDQVFVSGQVGGAAGAIQGFLTTLLTQSLGVRAHRIGSPDHVERAAALQEEKDSDTPWPGQVTPAPPGEEPPAPPPPGAPTPALTPLNQLYQQYLEALKKRSELTRKRLAGYPEEPEAPPGPPIEPTTLGMEEARKWMPWISEGEIRSSSDLPGLIEVAKNRLQAYKEKVLMDQATPEELKMLNTPGAPRLLILKLIEERLAQAPPGGPAPSARVPPEELPPTLPPVVPTQRPEIEPPVLPPAAAPAPEPVAAGPEQLVPGIPPETVVPEAQPQGALTEEEFQQTLGELDKFFPRTTRGGVPSETGYVPGAESVTGFPTTIPGAEGAGTLTPGLPGSLMGAYPGRPGEGQIVGPMPTPTRPGDISIPSPAEGAERPGRKSITPTTQGPSMLPGSVEDVTETPTDALEQTKEEYLQRVTDELLGESRAIYDRISGEGGVGFQDLVRLLGRDAALEMHRSPLNQSYGFNLIRKGKTKIGLDVIAEILDKQGVALPETGNMEGALAEWLYNRINERNKVRQQVEEHWRQMEREHEANKAPTWMGEVDEDFAGMAERAPASSFKNGETFMGIDGKQYTIRKSKGKIEVVSPAGKASALQGSDVVPFVERFVPGEAGSTYELALAEPPGPTPKAEKPDPFATAPPEMRRLLLKAGIHLYLQGTRTYAALQEFLQKRFGPGVTPYVAGLHNKLKKLQFTQEVPSAERPSAPVGPAVPSGPQEGRGAPAPPAPERGRPGKPGKGPEKAPGEAAPKPSPPKGPPPVTREIREGGIATLSRELLPVLPHRLVFPADELKTLTEKLGKKPLPHQIENAHRAMQAFGFFATNTIPNAIKETLSHAFLIADGTGTGKTLSAGLIIEKFFQREPKANIVIVVKNEDLARQWTDDVAGPMGWNTTLVSRVNPLKAGAERTIHFMTYKRMEIAWSEKTMPEMEKFAPDLVILDEAQALKNWVPGTKDQSAVVKTAAACEAMTRFSKNTLFMSATPFESVLHTGYLTMMKLWHPKTEWKQWLQDKLDLKFKDGYWTGLSPKKLAKFHRLLIGDGRMTKSEIDFNKLENSQGKKITLTTTNKMIKLTEEQVGEADRIGRIFNSLLEQPEVKRSFYKIRLVKSMRYLVFRALDENNKLATAIELGNKYRAEGKTVVFTLFRKNSTDLEEWMNNVLEGKRGSGRGKPYGEKSFMPALIQYLATNRIKIEGPVKTLQKAFPDFVPITGDEPSGGAVRQSNLQRLMKGEAPGGILTMAAGGTGLSVHDTIGKFPRVQINVSAPDTAGTMIQVAGRTFRLGSESSTQMFWLFGDTYSEGRLAAKIAWRLREMGALVTGKETNPTSDELEQFDFPEDPAGTEEEDLAMLALQEGEEGPGATIEMAKKEEPMLPGVETGKKSVAQQLKELEEQKRRKRATGEEAPSGPLFEAAEKQAFEKAQGKLFEPPIGERRGRVQVPPGARELEFTEEGTLKEGPLKIGRLVWTDEGVMKYGKYLGQKAVPRTWSTAAYQPGNVVLQLQEEETGKVRYFNVKEGGTRVFVVPPLEEEETAQMALAEKAPTQGPPPLPPRPDEAENYGFLPHFHREPNPEGTVTNLKSMREMIHDLERALTTRVAVGWFRPQGKGARNVLAHFEIWRNIIRGRLYYDVEVYSHEGGHRLDQLMFPAGPHQTRLGSATNPQVLQFKSELLAIAQAVKPGQSQIKEGFAEFVRFYLTNPTQAQKIAPKFYPFFETTLKTRLPQVYTAFQGVRSDWENMMNADPMAAVKMTIVSGAVKGGRVPKDFHPNKMYEAVVDEMAVIRNATDYLLKMTKLWDVNHQLPAELDPRILASTYVAWPDWVETWVKKGQFDWRNPDKKIGRSLMQIFKPVGNRLMDYEGYAKSREAINDLETKGWDPWEKYGIYENWARTIIKRHKAEFEPVYKEMVQFYSNIVDTWVASGLMSPEVAAKMRSKKGVYSPMWRTFIDQAMEDFQAPGTAGKRFANLPKVTFMRRGSRIESIPSIEAAYKMLAVTFKRAEENAIPLAMLKLAEAVPHVGGRDVAAVVPEPLRPVLVNPREVIGHLKLPKEVLEELDEDVLNEAIVLFRPSPFAPKAPYSYVWRRGKREFVEWDPEIYRALHFLGRHDFGVLDKALAPFVDALRAGAIVLSPSFQIRSAIKDPWVGLFQSKNPVLHAAYWIPSLFSALTGGEAMQRYKRSGGGVSTFMGIQPEDVAALAERDLARRYQKLRYWGNPKNLAHEMFGVMAYLGLALEYTPRLAEARVRGLMKAKTRSEFLATGFAGRNATVDFNMMGGFTRSLTRSAAFFGVGVGGWARTIREFRTNPLSATIKFAIFGALPAIYYYLYVRDDDRWKSIPQKERDQNFIFWLPGMDEPRRIPKPQEWGILMTMVERGLQAKDAEDPTMLTELAKSIGRNLPNPVPTGLMLGFELAANYSEHLSRPIAPTRGEPGERYWNYTAETAKGIGRLLGWSPAKIEYALRQASGGLSTKLTQKVEEELGLKEKRRGLPSGVETPFGGALVYRYPGRTTEQVDRFYDRYWVPASQVYESFTGKRKAEPEDLKRYLGQKSQYLALYYALRGFDKTLATMRDARSLITSSPTMSEEEKRRKLEALSQKMDAIAKKANEIGERILGGQMQRTAPGVH